MFKFFRKKQQNKNIEKAVKKAGKPFNLNDYKQDLQKLYDCSIQKKVSDFVVKTFDINGNTCNVAFDSADNCKGIDFDSLFAPEMLGQEIIFTHYSTKGFIGFNNCAILAQDWLINKAIVAPCEDAISIDYNVNLDDADDDDKEKIEELKELTNDKDTYDIPSICQKFAENKRKFGQAICYPLIDGVDYELPFNIDAVGKGTYKGMVVIEPIWISPVLSLEATTNPASLRFYEPTWFRLPNGQLIHHSWVVYNTYNRVADILKPTYYFGGVPLPQLMYEQVYITDKTAKEMPMLAQSKRLNYMEGNINAYLADSQKMENEIRLISWLRNNWGWLFVKKDQRIGQLDTSLTDFDAVVMLGYQLVSAISGVPSARLLETSPKGWQSTGSYEDNNYRRVQQCIQRIDYAPILELHFRLAAKSKYGIDKKYVCVFEPIDAPSAKELSEIREIDSRTNVNYINAGVISAEEVREVLREDENSGYNTLSEEMEGEGLENDPFNDIDGGSSNEQDPFSMDTLCLDEWHEEDHPRNKKGEFTNGSNSSSSNNKSSERHNSVKKRQRKPLNISNIEKAVLRDAVARNQFNDEEKECGYAIRYTSHYKYTLKIENAELLSYTPVRRWNIK